MGNLIHHDFEHTSVNYYRFVLTTFNYLVVQGIPGVAGAKGEQGDAGRQGDKGPSGPAGTKGQKGRAVSTTVTTGSFLFVFFFRLTNYSIS